MRFGRSFAPCVVAAVAVLSCAPAARGQEHGPASPGVSARVGYDAAYTRYAEDSVDIEERGVLHGGRAELMVRPGGRFEPVIGVEARAHFGSLRYRGRTQSGTPVEADGRDRLLEGRVIAGPSFSLAQTDLLVFLGFGVRDWNNDVNDPRAYERNVTYLYSPLGVRYGQVLSGLWGFAATIEYDLFWKGTVKSKLSDVDSSFSDLENHQRARSGFGVAAGLAVTRDFGAWTLTLEPFLRMWRVDDSDVQPLIVNGQQAGNAVEPRNTTTQLGVALLVGF